MNCKISIFFALLWSVLAPLQAQTDIPTLTLAEALDRGRAHVDFQTIAQGRAALADSKILEQQHPDNPRLFVSSENIDQAGVDTAESYVLLSQRLSLFGVRSMKTRAAQHEKNAVTLEIEAEKRGLDARVKERFFETLYFQKRLKVLEASLSNTQKIKEIVDLRKKAGQASGYDVKRLSRETAEARAMIERERAFFEASWEQLRTLLDLDKPYRLAGDLPPAPPVDGSSSAQHPSILAFDEHIKAASLEEKAARQWKLPEISLEAGMKRTRIAGVDDHGVFVSARVPLPLFDRNKSGITRARAKAMIARGEKAFAQSRAEGRSRALRGQIERLLASLDRFRQEAIGGSRELVDLAQWAYREGELDLLAVLDAHQSLRDAELKAVALEAETRALAIELELLGGRP